jgi:Tfp pilus assembly protein PilN
MPLLDTRRKKDTVDTSINLLPSDIKQEQNVQRRFQIAVAAAIALVVLLGAITVVQRIQIASEQRTLASEQAKAAKLQTQVDALHEFEVLKQSVDASRAALGTVLKGDISWTRFLDDLDTYMPADSWLASVNVTSAVGATPEGKQSLGTSTYSGSVRSFPGLAHWLDTMDAVPGFEFVYLSNGTKNKSDTGSVVTFSASGFVTDEMLSHRCESETSQCP